MQFQHGVAERCRIGFGLGLILFPGRNVLVVLPVGVLGSPVDDIGPLHVIHVQQFQEAVVVEFPTISRLQVGIDGGFQRVEVVAQCADDVVPEVCLVLLERTAVAYAHRVTLRDDGLYGQRRHDLLREVLQLGPVATRKVRYGRHSGELLVQCGHQPARFLGRTAQERH